MLVDFFNALWETTPLFWSHVFELLLLEQQEILRPALGTFVLICDSQGTIQGITCLDRTYDLDKLINSLEDLVKPDILERVKFLIEPFIELVKKAHRNRVISRVYSAKYGYRRAARMLRYAELSAHFGDIDDALDSLFESYVFEMIQQVQKCLPRSIVYSD